METCINGVGLRALDGWSAAIGRALRFGGIARSAYDRWAGLPGVALA